MKAFAGYDEDTNQLIMVGGVCKAKEFRANVRLIKESIGGGLDGR